MRKENSIEYSFLELEKDFFEDHSIQNLKYDTKEGFWYVKNKENDDFEFTIRFSFCNESMIIQVKDNDFTYYISLTNNDLFDLHDSLQINYIKTLFEKHLKLLDVIEVSRVDKSILIYLSNALIRF